MKSSSSEIDFRSVSVAVFGDVILDEYIYGRVSRLSPEAPVPVVEVQSRDQTLGGAGNVARNIRALGGTPFLFAVRGDDTSGEQLVALAKTDGLETAGIVIDKRRPTTFKQRVVARSVRGGAQQIVRIDSEDVRPVDSGVAARLLRAARRFADRCDVLIISDYDKGAITDTLLHSVIALFRGKKRPIVVDPNVVHFFQYRDVTVVTPNHLQLERVSGKRIRTEKELFRTGEEIQARLGAAALLITRGEEGMALFENGRLTKIPTVAREVYDVTGAGDTVVATLGLALGTGMPLEKSARLANAAAGIVVGKRGTAVASVDELARKVSTMRGNRRSRTSGVSR